MLFEHVLSSKNLRDAWQRVKQNKGAAGVDGLTIEDYPVWIHQHWADIQRGLQQGYYCQQQPKTEPLQQLKSEPLFIGLIH